MAAAPCAQKPALSCAHHRSMLPVSRISTSMFSAPTATSAAENSRPVSARSTRTGSSDTSSRPSAASSSVKSASTCASVSSILAMLRR